MIDLDNEGNMELRVGVFWGMGVFRRLKFWYVFVVEFSVGLFFYIFYFSLFIYVL